MTDLNWFGGVLIGLWILSALLTVGTVGKPRTPMEPGNAVVAVIINGLLIAGLLFIGTQS